MNLIREISNNYPVTIMLVTHTRKMGDNDPLNTISGSTGLIGAVDGAFILEKDIRFSNQGKLTITNRDTEEFIFDLEFDRIFCKWKLVNKQDFDYYEDDFVVMILEFLKDKKEWQGTATELLKELKQINENMEQTVSTLSRKLNKEKSILENKYGIVFDRKTEDNIKKLSLKMI